MGFRSVKHLVADIHDEIVSAVLRLLAVNINVIIDNTKICGML